MATRRNPTRTKPAGRRNAPQRGPRNPLGLLLVLIGAGGLVYVSCGPRRVADSPAPPPIQNAPPTTPEVPRARYEPRRERMKVEEQPAPEPEAPKRDTTGSGVEGPVGSPDVPKPGPLIVEPEVRLTPEAPAEAPAEPPARVPAPVRAPAARRGEFERNPGARGEVALTFDGCYDDKPLPRILGALDRRGYKATFFIAGRFADRYPDSVRRISDDGMELGNHSWSHPKFTALTDAQIDSQLNRTNELIHRITGQKPALFRPPFGDRDERVRRQVAAEGFSTVCWALDSWDSVKKGITSDEISKRVLDRVKPGDVVLLHVGSQATADALPAILDGLESRGLKVVPVSQLMKG